jgi:hypothetical protein
MSKKIFEAAARTLAESKMLGLFAEGTAHELVTNQFADIFAEMSPLFNRDRFLQASGVSLIDHSDDIIPGCSNKLVR